jgi:dihydroorotate dehydrogenase electron transfer subunit
MLFLAHTLHERGQEFAVLLGARSAQELAHAGDFAKYTSAVFLVTDDGSLGRQGIVTDFVPEIIAQFSAIPKLCACGPMPMLAALAALAAKEKLALDVSLEARMACGVGACLACTCFLRDGNTARVCADGPVFPYEVLDWRG